MRRECIKVVPPQFGHTVERLERVAARPERIIGGVSMRCSCT